MHTVEPTMQYNRLGNSGLLVSELSFGSWVTFDSSNKSGTVGGTSRAASAESCYEIMKAAYLGGVNLFDNAEAYAQGEAEMLMGDAVHLGIERKVWTRADLVLTTKIMFGALPPKTRDDYIPSPITQNVRCSNHFLLLLLLLLLLHPLFYSQCSNY